MTVAYRETNTNHLRFDQLKQKHAQVTDLEAALNPPRGMERVLQLANVPGARNRLRALKRSLESGAPRAYAENERDLAVARRRELEDEIRRGMPTSVEMRRNLPDSVRKHMAWEKANKAKVWEWKAIGRRLAATEAGNSPLEPANYEQNVEVLRPIGSEQVDTAGAQIAGKTFMLPDTTTPATVFSDDDLAWLGANEPDVAMRLVRLNNDQRAELKAIIDTMRAGKAAKPAAAPAAPRAAKLAKPPKRQLSPEHLERLREAAAKGRAARAAKLAAQQDQPETDEQAA